MKSLIHNLGMLMFLGGLPAVFVAGFGCRETPPEPPDDTPKPGKRDYVWTIDTLAYPGSFQTLMRDIWASSPTDVYVVGHNDQAGWGSMYHYDGSRWTPVRLLANQGGTITQGFDLSAVYGFAPNDVYAVGNYIYSNPNPPPNFLDSSLIIHFDGSQWREVPIPKGYSLWTINGFTKQRVWAGGRLGTAYLFDGNEWVPESMPLTFSSEFTWGMGATSDGRKDFVTISALRLETGQTQHYFLRRVDNQWQLIDSFYVGYDNVEPKFGAKYWFLPSGEMYSIGYGFFRWTGERWQTFYLENETATGMWGTRTEHLFLTVNNHLLHYNGEDFFRYEAIGDQNWTYYAVWCNESEVFVVTNDGLRTYMLHGR